MSTVERKSVNISMDLTTMLTGRILKEKIEEKIHLRSYTKKSTIE
jgi:hypothetical protein